MEGGAEICAPRILVSRFLIGRLQTESMEALLRAVCKVPEAPFLRGSGERCWGGSGSKEGKMGPRVQWNAKERKLPLVFAHEASWEGLLTVSEKKGPMAGLGTLGSRFFNICWMDRWVEE